MPSMPPGNIRASPLCSPGAVKARAHRTGATNFFFFFFLVGEAKRWPPGATSGSGSSPSKGRFLFRGQVPRDWSERLVGRAARPQTPPR